jgi:hypothetical protein
MTGVSAADLEDLAFNGDLLSPDELLNTTDGWLKKAGKQVTADINFDDVDSVVAVFDKALNSLDTQYKGDITQLKLYVNYTVADAYRTYLGQKVTALGDRAAYEHIALFYKGIEVVHVPVLDRNSELKVLLSNPNNLVYGVFHAVTIETERVAKQRKTDFILTVEADAHLEIANAAVAVTVTDITV